MIENGNESFVLVSLPVNWSTHLSPPGKDGDSGGMIALLNKTIAQEGGVIDNYWTPI